MLFLSGCQLFSKCFYTLPRAIKEKKKKEEGVGFQRRGKVEKGKRKERLSGSSRVKKGWLFEWEKEKRVGGGFGSFVCKKREGRPCFYPFES